MSQQPTPTALIILDGWGHSDTSKSNAIAAAHTPVWDQLWNERPRTLISASGLDVGLPEGQMGNSEVGHMIMGSGRVIYQNYTRITKDIADGRFAENPAITSAIDKANQAGGDIHIMGLLSPGGVHSHQDHIHAMVDIALAQGANRVFVHAFLDGRDTPPRSAEPSLKAMGDKLAASGRGRLASICGRYYAMDRDNRWERVQSAYDLLTAGTAPFRSSDPVSGLQAAYERGEDDEFVQATLIQGDGETAAAIKDGDAVICMNFRADRAREITRAFVEPDFDGFTRSATPQLADYLMLTEYAADIDTSCAYPPTGLPNVLGDYVAGLGKSQLRIAETEKYAHVTFFFSGGQEDPFNQEERILVPSPQVATYDLKPEMSAFEVTDKLVEVIENQQHDLIVCNFANGDMVGHTGKFDAAVKAVEALDICLGRIVEALNKAGGECLITADHGNVEEMIDETSGQPLTAHTCEQVPLVYVNQRQATLNQRPAGLADVAPSLLHLMGIDKPAEMTGASLIEFE